MSSHILIRAARRRARLTQAELAARAGTTQSAIARWEAGKSLPSLEKLQSLVECCDLELAVTLTERRPDERELLERTLSRTPEERLSQLMAAIPTPHGAQVTADATGDPGGEPPFDPLAILAALARHDVRYVLIGGLAATLHGSPFLSADIDITPERSVANLERLAAALVELGAALGTEVQAPEVQAHPALERVSRHSGPEQGPDAWAAASMRRISTPFGSLNILFEPAGTTGFEDLRAQAELMELRGVRVNVASLSALIRSKEAGSSGTDQGIITTLRRLHRQSAGH